MLAVSGIVNRTVIEYRSGVIYRDTMDLAQVAKALGYL
jgi:hypothetical protein